MARRRELHGARMPSGWATSFSVPHSPFSLLRRREVCGASLPAQWVTRYSSVRLPGLLKEHELRSRYEHVDKIFAAAWIGDDLVVGGSKDNQLIVWDVSTGKSLLHPYHARGEPRRSHTDHCGIHCVCVSPDGRLLATGGIRPEDIVICELPSLQPVASCMGHTDWLFASAWITDRLLVSGSRDSRVMLWDMGLDGRGADALINLGPVQVADHHTAKVRALALDRNRTEFGTLSADCTLKIWNPELALCRSLVLEHKAELVCTEFDPVRSLYAVGSQCVWLGGLVPTTAGTKWSSSTREHTEHLQA